MSNKKHGMKCPRCKGKISSLRGKKSFKEDWIGKVAIGQCDKCEHEVVTVYDIHGVVRGQYTDPLNYIPF